MPLVLVRVDCRLIHGQVIEAWVPHVRADCLVVANDEAAEDPLQRSIMAMAVPPNLEVAILKIKDAVKALTGGRWPDKRVLLLVASCKDALNCYRVGLRFEKLNLGNLVCSSDKYNTCTLAMDPGDLDYLKEITASGIQVEARPVPLDQSQNICHIIESGL